MNFFTNLITTNIYFQLGIGNIFSDYVDFSEITDTPVKINSVKQKAFIEVKEGGTEAAYFDCKKKNTYYLLC